MKKRFPRKPRKPRKKKQLKKRARLKYLKDNPWFALKIAWQNGYLKHKLYRYQLELYAIFENTKSLKTVVNASRRWGKTTIALLYAIIFAIKHPNSQIKIATKTQKSLKKTITPIWRMLVEDCPREFMPKWDGNEDCYVFPNGSQIHIHGTDAQRHDGLRGQRCDLGIVDEAAFCSDLRYVVQSILLPQTLTCNGKIIILSTPEQKATTSGEEFKEFCLEAQRNNSYYCKDIYSNKALSPKIIEQYKEESGGEDSIEWQVEYLCQFKIDPEKSIVPEWKSKKFVLAEDFDPERNHYFKFYHKYTCLDLGVKRDFTVGLSAYYDFQEATLFVLNEFSVKNTTTPNIVAMLKACEHRAWGNQPIYRRVSDSDNPQLLNDLVSLHNIGIMAVSKSTLEAMVNKMRMMVGAGQVKVHPRCGLLIRTLENATWADDEAGKMHKNFARTVELGHMDAVASLMYLIQSLNKSTNPIPTTYGINLSNSLINYNTIDSHNKTQFKKNFVTPAKRNKGRILHGR